MEKKQTAMTSSEILRKHEDANEMHFHEVDRKLIIEAMEEYAKAYSQRLETLAKLLAKTWFYGKWEWETPNERIQQMIMQDLGYYPFKDEDEMIRKTRVDEDLYKEAVDKVALRNPRTTPVECHNSSNICDKEKSEKPINLTAVEWLEQEFIKLESTTGVYGVMYELIKQAKQMEKEQIMDAYGIVETTEQGDIMNAEQYYNETYGK